MRSFFYLSLAILVISLTSCQKTVRQPLSSETEATLNLLPAEANVIAYSNFEKFQTFITDSAFLKSLSVQPPRFKGDLDEFIKETGLDPRRDIKEIFIASKAGFPDQKQGLIVIKGDFNPEKLIEKLRQEEPELLVEQNEDQFTVKTLKHEMILVFKGHNLIAGGAPDYVESFLAGRKNQNPLLQKTAALPYLQDQWLIADVSAIQTAKLDSSHFKLPPAVKKIETIGVSVKAGETIHFYGFADCDNAESAGLLLDLAKGLVSGLKLNVSTDREIVDLINRIGLKTKGATVTGTYSINKEEIKKLSTIQNKITALL